MKDLRWNQDRTRQLLARLGPIPYECELTPVLGGVHFEDYEDLIIGTREEKLLKGYISCLFVVASQILRSSVLENERVELLFEEQKQYKPYASIALSSCFSAPDIEGNPKLAKWGFVTKGTTIMTDPADYLAFALREVWTDENSKKSEWCKPIIGLDGGGSIGATMSRAEIREVVVNAKKIHLYKILEQIPGKQNESPDPRKNRI